VRAICVKCQQERFIHAHFMCRPCYNAEQKREYVPAKRVSGDALRTLSEDRIERNIEEIVRRDRERRERGEEPPPGYTEELQIVFRNYSVKVLG